MRIHRALIVMGILGMVASAPAAFIGGYQWTTATNPTYSWVQDQVWVNGYLRFTGDWLNAYTCNWNGDTIYDQFNDHWIYNYNTGRYEDVKYIYIPGDY